MRNTCVCAVKGERSQGSNIDVAPGTTAKNEVCKRMSCTCITQSTAESDSALARTHKPS